MGALSSCCAVEQGNGKETVHEGGGDSAAYKGAGGSAAGGREGTAPKPVHAHHKQSKEDVPSQEAVDRFERQLEDCMKITVLLADGTELLCKLQWVQVDKKVVISCEVGEQTNRREIPLSELKAVLHGRDQLKRVETKANLVDDPNCVALHMVTGNCIPMRFASLEDKRCFVELIKQLKR